MVEPIERNKLSLSDRVAERIRSMIDNGEFRQGDRLPPQDQLAAQFSVSRTALREALKKMESIGLIESKVGQGTFISAFVPKPFVKPLTSVSLSEKNEMLGLLEVRKIIEVKAAGLAAERATEEEIGKIHQTLQEMERSMRDINAFSRMDFSFHLAIISAAHNPILSRIVGTIRDLLRKEMKVYSEVKGVMEKAIRFHQQIYQAIRERNIMMAEKLMHDHLDSVEKAVLEVDLSSSSSSALTTAKRKYVIGIHCHSFQPPWGEAINAARMRAEELGKEYNVDIKIDAIAPRAFIDVPGQMKIAEGFISRGVDHIIVVPITESSMQQVIKKANDADIPIGLFLTTEEPAGVSADWWLVNDDYEGGYHLGEVLGRTMEGKGNVAIMHGYWEESWDAKRAFGVKAGLAKYPDIKVVTEMAGGWERVPASRLMEDWLVRFGDSLSAVVALNDEMALGARRVVLESGLDIIIVGWDGTREAIEAVRDGRRDYLFTVDMNFTEFGKRWAELAWQTILARERCEEIENRMNIVKVTLVNKGNADQILERIRNTLDMKKTW